MAISPARKKRAIVAAVVTTSFLLFSCPTNHFILDGSFSQSQFTAGIQHGYDDDILNLIIADDYSADPRYKSEQMFWDVYRGDDDDWYKEYRMSKSTLNRIVSDCVPYLYSIEARGDEFKRYRYTRAKVTMATLIRFLATQLDQHSIGKEFGVRQPCECSGANVVG